MASENKTNASGQNSGLSGRNGLILKIALFLNYLSKENYQKLLYDLQQHKDTPEIDILKLTRAKNYIRQADILSLKKICVNFARAQEDTRFGALCINFDFLTQSNLDLALEEQKRASQEKQNMLLGDLLVDAGMLSERQRNLILQKQKFENTTRKNTPAEPFGTSETLCADDEHETLEEPPVFDKSRMREIREAGILLLIQNDALKAFITKTNDFDNSICLTDLKDLLGKNGIIYGLVDDQGLETFIKEEKYKATFLKVAEGLESIDETDAEVVYLFDRDYLKPGRFSEDGTIDFKERGKIPFVSAGDVLAEKIPPKEGKDGVSIFGDSILKAKAMDISFILGKGVRLSKDGLQVISDVNGNPKAKPTGEISVNDAYYIEGDVDFTTGHVKFDKNVYITGSIKRGFRVEAIDVVVNAVDGGIIKAQGDVFIQNGAAAAVIEARGSIKAGFMLKSKVSCMSNMTIVKEIIHCEIVLEGALEMKRGRMFSSSITAKGGVKIFNIGSAASSPATITVGTSNYLKKELQNIDSVIEKRQNLFDSLSFEKDRIESELKSHALNDEKTLLETKLKKISHDIEACAKAVKISANDKFMLKRIQQANPPKPILEIGGKALAGTRIFGRYSNLTLKENVSYSRIMEINSRSDEGLIKDWEMIITKL